MLYKQKQSEFNQMSESMRKSKLNQRKMKTLRVDYLRQSHVHNKSPHSELNTNLDDSYKVGVTRKVSTCRPNWTTSNSSRRCSNIGSGSRTKSIKVAQQRR